MLGTRLLGWRHLGYVEWNEYCQMVLERRMRDGAIDRAPVFGDIRAFIDQGFAARYREMVDVVTGGFPCQPFSAQGVQLGADDPRNMWPDTAVALSIVRPRFALLENVPGLLRFEYFGKILADLEYLGYSARWGCFSACQLGAPHTRLRLFILAYPASCGMGCAPHAAQWWREVQPDRDRERAARWQEGVSAASGAPHGMARWVERRQAVGNGQVPAVVGLAWRTLTRGLNVP